MTIEEQIKKLKLKLAARKGQKAYADNIRAIEEQIERLERGSKARQKEDD